MGTGSHGQSIETTMTQIVADEMGVSIEDVHFIQGDTDSTPYGHGTGGSRTAGIAGGAAHEAAAAMRERVLGVAGLMLEIDPGDLEMSGSVARVKGDPDSNERDAGRDRRGRLSAQPRRAAARLASSAWNYPGATSHRLSCSPTPATR